MTFQEIWYAIKTEQVNSIAYKFFSIEYGKKYI